MSEDREILRELWNGQIPVHFSLASKDVSTMETPQPYFALIPRQTYFPLSLDKIVKHFSKYIQSGSVHEPWLEFEGVPLKMHYPVGVLYDLFGHDRPLPWAVTVNFSNFPDDLIHLPNREALESHFMSTLKEADVLKHKNTVVSNMQKKDHKQLWTGLMNDRFDQFWAINKKLMEVPTDHPYFRYVPFRIYRTEKPFIQKLVKPADENHRLSLADLLHVALPESDQSSRTVLIQGIQISGETPLQWLSEHFSYPDNFLHICVHTS